MIEVLKGKVKYAKALHVIEPQKAKNILKKKIIDPVTECNEKVRDISSDGS